MNFRVVDWFYVQNGRQIGPVPVGQFDDLVRSGIVLSETLVWREGLENWQPLGSIPLTPPSTSSALAPPPLPGAPGPVLTACAECGFKFPQSEMIPFASSWICARCKPIFLQRMREGAPMAAGGAEAWQSGPAVVTLHGGKLPMRCVRCNAAATGKPIERTLYHLVRLHSTVSVPICEKCRRRRRIAIAVSWLLWAIGLGAVIAASAIDSEALVTLTLVLWIAAVFLGLSKGVLVSTARVNAQYIWMRGFCKEYRESLPEFPSSR